MSVSERTKERNRIKRQIVKIKDDLVKRTTEIRDSQGVALAQITLVGTLLDTLANLQTELNALSAPVDEKQLLEQSMKRTDRAAQNE